jgi:hypothetical protein
MTLQELLTLDSVQLSLYDSPKYIREAIERARRMVEYRGQGSLHARHAERWVWMTVLSDGSPFSKITPKNENHAIQGYGLVGKVRRGVAVELDRNLP